MKPPPGHVLAGFGVTAKPELLDGGQGTTWKAGDVVLKPADLPAESTWRAEILNAMEDNAAFRVARPARAQGGSWLVDGWEAWHAVVGMADHQRPDDVIQAGIAFHSALVDGRRPSFLDTRDDRWTYADRMAWDEIPLEASPRLMDILQPIAQARTPVRLPSQLVHGDLLGNVLFADGIGPPAIIDWPVYYRPTAWATAVVVVDAVTWYDASPALIDRWSQLPAWRQMIIRAFMYRVVTEDVVGLETIDEYRTIVQWILDS